VKRNSVTALASLVLCLPALAAPAAWHKWRSKLNGAETCAQTAPGPGWELADGVNGPYRDARCSVPGRS
jgi:hypothetical protein